MGVLQAQNSNINYRRIIIMASSPKAYKRMEKKLRTTWCSSHAFIFLLGCKCRQPSMSTLPDTWSTTILPSEQWDASRRSNYRVQCYTSKSPQNSNITPSQMDYIHFRFKGINFVIKHASTKQAWHQIPVVPKVHTGRSYGCSLIQKSVSIVTKEHIPHTKLPCTTTNLSP